MKFEARETNLVLLITATIDVENYSELLRSNSPELRISEYSKALDFWLSMDMPPFDGIVFCENSGYDLSELKQRFIKSEDNRPSIPIEWLSFNGNERPKGMHYGYSELGIIDYALKNSTLLKSSEGFFKVTGRLIFPKFKKIASALPQGCLFIADFHRYKSDEVFPYRVRTQIFFSKTNFYIENLINVRNKMTQRVHFIEDLLARELWEKREDTDVYFRFPLECPPVGVSASIGSDYGSLTNIIKFKIRGFFRCFLPKLWL